MAKTFKNIPSLHRLLESAPLESVRDLLLKIDEQGYAACFDYVDWPEADSADDIIEACRLAVLEVAAFLQPDAGVPLEQHASRILNLAEGRGVEAVAKVADRIFDSANSAEFAQQRDDYGRAIYLYLHEGELFDDAENLFYADHYRNLGRMYEAFEVDANGGLDFQWDDTVKASLEAKLQQALELPDNCKIDHIRVTGKREDGTEVASHLLIIRHAGPLSSVAAMKDGRKKPMYYRPAIEATLLFSPDEAIVEVFAASPGVRPVVASAFAEVGLKHNLSDRPLTLRQYNLSRFLTSLRLDAPTVAGFDIESVTVVEAEVRPQNFKHRASLRVAIGDDIETVAADLFGPNNIFKRAALVSRIVVAVRYSADGEAKTKALNITLSDPNRCNLRSNRDPKQRDFGFKLLEHWGLMQQVRPLDAAEECAAFPALLRLYDEHAETVTRRHLDTRGILLDPLLEGGFLVRRGRHSSIEVELENGETQLVTVQSSPTIGHVRYECPVSRQWVEIPAQSLDYFEIKREWIEERIIKGLKSSLKPVGQMLQEQGLIFLGVLDLDGESIPAYLARQLSDQRVIRDYDIQLRAHQNAGIGVVLACCETAPAFLGCHVVVPLATLLVADAAEPTVDLVSLKSVYGQGKVLARGGQTVDFIVEHNRSGSLFIPGKPVLTVVGEKQIKLVQRLVDAYRAGNPAVVTKDLMDGLGSASPSQAFRNWKEQIADIYIGQAEGKRGAWKLLV